jgi:hypothetical protein
LYNRFCEREGRLLSETKFRELVPKYVKRPTKATGKIIYIFMEKKSKIIQIYVHTVSNFQKSSKGNVNLRRWMM